MRLLSAAPVLVALMFAAATARAETAVEATVTDIFGFELRLTELVLSRADDPEAELPAATLEHLQLAKEDHSVILWLVSIKEATFEPAENDAMTVRAVLQEEGREVTGLLKNASRHAFEGRLPDADEDADMAHVPLVETRSLVVHTEFESPNLPTEPGDLHPPMPEPDEDVLWVSSIPAGAEVWIRAVRGPSARQWRDYRRLGETPLTSRIPPGTWAVRVMVPAEIADGLKPAPQLDEHTNPFEHDGWEEIGFRRDAHVVASVTYNVVKRQGRAASVNALFQLKDQPLDEVVETFPSGRNFHYNVPGVMDRLRERGIPRAEVFLMLQALARGGKIVWHGEEESLMAEVTPGGEVEITEAIRPSANREED